MKQRHAPAWLLAAALALSLTAQTGLTAQPGKTQPADTQAHRPDQPGASDPLSDRSTPEWARSFGGFRHYTEPSRDSEMGFTVPSTVQEVLVEVGQSVRKGELLVRARDAEALAALAIQERRAKNDYAVQEADVNVRLAEVELAVQKELQDKGSGSKLDYDRAFYTLERARVTAASARESLAEQQLQLDRLRAEVERVRLVAPFDGTIESVDADEGQAINESQMVVRVVNIDRLRLNVPVPIERVMASGLKAGDAAWVLLNTPEAPAVYQGVVIGVGSAGDFASQKTQVLVEIPNPDRRPAGLTAWVRLEPPSGDWAGRVAPAVIAAAGEDRP